MSEQLVKVPVDVSRFIRENGTIVNLPSGQDIYFMPFYFVPEEDQENIYTMCSIEDAPEEVKKGLGLWP